MLGVRSLQGVIVLPSNLGSAPTDLLLEVISPRDKADYPHFKKLCSHRHSRAHKSFETTSIFPVGTENLFQMLFSNKTV